MSLKLENLMACSYIREAYKSNSGPIDHDATNPEAEHYLSNIQHEQMFYIMCFSDSNFISVHFVII